MEELTREQTILKEESITLNQNEFTNPSGETFIGWNTSADGTGTSYSDQQSQLTFNENTSLYAQWGYPITWDSNGGTSVNNSLIRTGNQIGTLPTTTRSGFTLNGWYTQTSGGDKISKDQIVSNAATYYAHWTGNKYTCSTKYWSDNGFLFKSIPKGQYKLEIIDLYVEHSGSHASHVFYPQILVWDAKNTSKFTWYALNGTLSNYNSTYVRLDNVPVLNNGNTKYVRGVVVSGSSMFTKFSITNNSFQLPYANNKIAIRLIDPQLCGKGYLVRIHLSASTILAKMTRVN